MSLRLEPGSLVYHEGSSTLRSELVWCDVVGAEMLASGAPGVILTSADRQAGCCGRGATDASPFCRLKRVRVALGTTAESRESVVEIRRRAAGPPPAHVTVIVNPNSGGREGVRILEQIVQPMLQAAGWPATVVITEHGAHLRDLGRAAVAAVREAMAAGEALQPRPVVVIGGDGTVGEFVNALLRCCCEATAGAPKTLPAAILAAVFGTLRICAIPCGTQNALARGLRTVHPVHALMCVLRGQLRPLDAFLARNGSGEHRLGFCGFAWGVPGAIAGSSEAYRWLGRGRYAVLKARHGVPVGLGLASYSATVTWAPAFLSDRAQQHAGGAGKGAAEPSAAILANEADVSSECSSNSRLRRGPAGATPRGAPAAVASPGLQVATLHTGGSTDRHSRGKVELTTCMRRCGTCRQVTEASAQVRHRASVALLTQACLAVALHASGLTDVEAASPSAEACAASVRSPADTITTLATSPSEAELVECPSATSSQRGAADSIPVTIDSPLSRPSSSVSASTGASLSSPLLSPTRRFGGGDDSSCAASSISVAALNSEPAAPHRTAVATIANGGLSTHVTAEDSAVSVSGSVVAVGIVNTAPDARFSHAADGLLDVIVARKGGPVSSVGLLLRYVGRALGVSDERHSPLYRYEKATHARLSPLPGQEGLPANVDGEAWGPGPFTVTALPSLLLAYGEL